MAGAKDRLLKSIAKQAPGIDTSGPVTDLFVTPFGEEVDDLDRRIASTKRLFSGEFDPARSAEEIIRTVATRGVQRDPGRSAAGYISLRSAVPPVGIRVPGGTIVSTLDDLYQYMVVDEFAPSSAEVQAGYNTAISQYEYLLPVRAIQPGSRYNIAATRIRRISIALPAGAYIINPEAITGGTDPQSLADLWDEYRRAAIITDRSNRNGIAEHLTKTFTDLRSVYIRNNMVPANPISGTSAAINVHIIGEQVREVRTSVTLNTQGQVQLEHDFIRSVNFLRRGSERIELLELTGQTLRVLEEFTPGEELIVDYTYNHLAHEINAYLADLSHSMFGYSYRAVEGTPEDIRLALQVRVQSGLAGSDIEAQIRTRILNHFNTRYFTNDDLNRADVTDLLKQDLVGIVSARVLDMVLISRTQQLTGFPLYIAPPRYVRLLSDNLTVTLTAG